MFLSTHLKYSVFTSKVYVNKVTMSKKYTTVTILGADGIALSNSAMQAIGCVGAKICNTNNYPAGIATQKKELCKKLDYV